MIKKLIIIILILTFSLNQLAGMGYAYTDTLRPAAYKRTTEITESVSEKIFSEEPADMSNVALSLEIGLDTLKGMVSKMLKMPGRKGIVVVLDGSPGTGLSDLVRRIKREGIPGVKGGEIDIIDYAREKRWWGHRLFSRIMGMSARRKAPFAKIVLFYGTDVAGNIQADPGSGIIDIYVDVTADEDSRMLRIDKKILFLIQKEIRLKTPRRDARFDLTIDNSISADKRNERRILSVRKKFEKGAGTMSHLIYEFLNELTTPLKKAMRSLKEGISISRGPEKPESRRIIRSEIRKGIFDSKSGFDQEQKHRLYRNLDSITQYICNWQERKFFGKEVPVLTGRVTIEDTVRALEKDGGVLLFSSDENYYMALAGLIELAKKGYNVANKFFVFNVEEYLDRTGEWEIVEDLFEHYQGRMSATKEVRPSDVLMERFLAAMDLPTGKSNVEEEVPGVKKMPKDFSIRALRAIDSQA